MVQDLKWDNPLFKDKGCNNMEVNKEVKHKTISPVSPRLRQLLKLLNRELQADYSMDWIRKLDHHLNKAISNNNIIIHLNNSTVTVAIIKATINKLLQHNPQLNNNLKAAETKVLVTRGKAGHNDMEAAFRMATPHWKPDWKPHWKP